MDQWRSKPTVSPGDFARFASQARLFGATDQRDCSYALRGLVLDSEKGEAPDYSKSEPQVSEQSARHSISCSKRLGLLSQAGIHSNALPS